MANRVAVVLGIFVVLIVVAAVHVPVTEAGIAQDNLVYEKCLYYCIQAVCEYAKDMTGDDCLLKCHKACELQADAADASNMSPEQAKQFNDAYEEQVKTLENFKAKLEAEKKH